MSYDNWKTTEPDPWPEGPFPGYEDWEYGSAEPIIKE